MKVRKCSSKFANVRQSSHNSLNKYPPIISRHRREGKMYFRYNVETGLYEKTVKIRGTEYLLQVNQENWNDTTSKSISRWLRTIKSNPSIPLQFRWGRLCDPSTSSPINETKANETIQSESIPIYVMGQGEIESSPINKSTCWSCAGCGKGYESRSGLWKHENICVAFKKWLTEPKLNIKSDDTVVNTVYSQSTHTNHTTSQSTIAPPTVTTGPTQINHIQNNNQNITNQTIHINIRDFGNENPNWLTANTLYKVIGNVDRAIPMLMQKKHFNDEFPENMNLRVNTKGDVNQRLQVREGGKWRIRDSKQTFYKVVIDMYEILSEALNDETDDTTAEEDGIHPEVIKVKKSSKFTDKVNKIRPLWEGFKTKMDELHDPELMTELWEDLKTFLLDRKLCIEQETD